MRAGIIGGDGGRRARPVAARAWAVVVGIAHGSINTTAVRALLARHCS